MTEIVENSLRRKNEDLYNSFKSIFGLLKRHSLLAGINLKNPYYVDHGEEHTRRIIENLTEIIPAELMKELSGTDLYIMLLSAIFHDWGMMIEEHDGKVLLEDERRKLHPLLSRDFVMNNHKSFQIGKEYAIPIAKICYCHSRSFCREFGVNIGNFLERVKTVYREEVHERLAGAIFRLADAFDADKRRAPELFKEYVLNLPDDHKRHWEVCQFIPGIRFEPDQSRVIVDAYFSNEVEKKLLTWKILDLYSEVVDVAHILPTYRLSYSNVIGNLENTNTHEHAVIDAREKEGNQRERLSKYSVYREKFLKELAEVWSSSKADSDKVLSSFHVFKTYLSDYWFTSIEKVMNFEFLRKIERERKEEIDYLEDGCTLSKISRTIINISDMPLKSEKLAFQGVAPVDERFYLKVFDDKTHELLNFRYLKDTPHEKLIEIDIGEIEPCAEFSYSVEVKWPYPLQDAPRRRWYGMNLNSFVLAFSLKITLPTSMMPRDVIISETKKGDEYSWENIIDQLTPISENEKVKIEWRRKVLGSNRLYKCYYTTPI